jgi:hypothetical protein
LQKILSEEGLKSWFPTEVKLNVHSITEQKPDYLCSFSRLGLGPLQRATEKQRVERDDVSLKQDADWDFRVW